MRACMPRNTPQPKLKGHIKSPNAPELVHFLFHPLDFLVEASLAVVEPNEEPIWQRVITPLFQQDTLNFFDDCLVSNEADLLKSLGTAWNISSDERYILVFTPVFFRFIFVPPPQRLLALLRLRSTRLQTNVCRWVVPYRRGYQSAFSANTLHLEPLTWSPTPHHKPAISSASELLNPA